VFLTVSSQIALAVSFAGCHHDLDFLKKQSPESHEAGSGPDADSAESSTPRDATSADERDAAHSGDVSIDDPGSGDASIDATDRDAEDASVRMPGLHRLAVGAAFVCAIKDDAGSVFCMGSNGRGQLGIGVLQQPNDPATTTWSQVLVSGGGGLQGALALAAGLSNTCAATEAGVVCWGSSFAA